MILQYTFSIPVQGVPEYVKNTNELPPLPEYIHREGPYFREAAGAENQVITVYEFEKPKFPEALKKIAGQLDAFRTIPGFIFSVDVLSSARP